MTYKPTGNAPGRPRADGKPAGSVKPVPKPLPKVELEPVLLTNTQKQKPWDNRNVVDSGKLCEECFPGVTEFHNLACSHGSWHKIH